MSVLLFEFDSLPSQGHVIKKRMKKTRLLMLSTLAGMEKNHLNSLCIPTDLRIT